MEDILARFEENLLCYYTEKDALYKEIERLNAKRDALRLPIFEEQVLPLVLERLNQRMAAKDIVFEQYQNWLKLDYKNSKHLFLSLVQISYCEQTLFFECHNRCRPFHSIDELVSMLEDEWNIQLKQNATIIQNTQGGLETIKEKAIKERQYFELLPEKELTQDYLYKALSQNPYLWELIPLSFLDKTLLYAALESFLEHKISECYLWKIMDEKALSFVDKEMILTCAKQGINLYCKGSHEWMEQLGGFEHEFLMKSLPACPEILRYIPAKYMRDEYVRMNVKDGHWQWECCEGLENITQETADLMFEKEPSTAIKCLPDNLKTLEMCHQIKDRFKNKMKEYYPARHLDAGGKLKRLTKK